MAGGKSRGGGNGKGAIASAPGKAADVAEKRSEKSKSEASSEKRQLGHSGNGQKKPRGLKEWLEYKYMQYNVTR